MEFVSMFSENRLKANKGRDHPICNIEINFTLILVLLLM